MKEIILDKIKEAIGGLLQERNTELVDMTYRREQGGMVLRLLVDKEGGITLDDCVRLNEEIGGILERDDIMPEKYLLEVSSPGLDRPLKTRRDFEKVLGSRIRVHTFEPVSDKRDWEGVVNSVDDEKVRVDNIEIPLGKISKAKLVIEL